MQANGWDVVYACSGEFINVQLADNASAYIQDFSYEDDSIIVKGSFSPWKLVAGGSGSILQFETPISQGVVIIKSSNTEIPLNGAVPLVQMQLTLVNGSSNQISHQLVFHCTQLGKGKGDTTPGAVSVIDPDTSGALKQHPDGATAAALLVAGLGNCFIQNAKQLSYVFADVLPVPSGANSSWLTPKKLTYAYQQPGNGMLGGLAILGLLDSDNDNDLPHYFDSNLLKGDADFGFILAAKPFLQHVIMPTLPAAYGGNASEGDFKLNSDGKIVQNQGFHLNSVKVGAIDYTPGVTSLWFEIDDTTMRCYTATKTDITGLADAYVENSVTSNNPSHFDLNSRTLSFSKDPNMAVTQSKHIPWWESLLGALTLGIMNAVVEGISLAIENGVGSLVSSKTAQSLGNVAPGLVSWHGQSSMKVTAGGLEDNVYMKGKLNQ